MGPDIFQGNFFETWKNTKTQKPYLMERVPGTEKRRGKEEKGEKMDRGWGEQRRGGRRLMTLLE